MFRLFALLLSCIHMSLSQPWTTMKEPGSHHLLHEGCQQRIWNVSGILFDFRQLPRSCFDIGMFTICSPGSSTDCNSDLPYVSSNARFPACQTLINPLNNALPITRGLFSCSNLKIQFLNQHNTTQGILITYSSALTIAMVCDPSSSAYTSVPIYV